ncbi:hypothetical protein MJO28_006117 [Puccinia striiformis f. sp. tritici]|uniref:Uncharacterized protein n=1 Tax=Puccinia striiformis f. sp. tritici TaxID=168172 RepID=A0ACC0EGP3_9BASI|nr:hypothetical protein MJO28_006117 [Puccinia striiformis f. sp. tritici]
MEGEHTVYYKDLNGLRKQMRTGKAKRTTLTEFFRLNRLNAIGYGVPARSLLYHDIPRYFTWTKSKRFKGRKQTCDTIGRVYFASINQGERYYLRLLLLNVRGPTSFVDLRTVDGIIYGTFREAADNLGLLVSDRHYNSAMQEASQWMTGSGLRFMFCMLLLHSPPADPVYLLASFIEPLSDDLLHLLEHRYCVAEPTVQQRYSLCFFLINKILADHGKGLADVGLNAVIPYNESWDLFASDSSDEEDQSEHHLNEFLTMSERLNARQTEIFETVLGMVDNEDSDLLYIDGPGGCGKTYLMNTIIHYLKGNNVPVITVASSGVASLMLVGGMTAHSRFRIPLDVNTTSQCNWKTRAPKTQALLECRVIIWDEISMQNRFAVEAVDRTFRDLLEDDRPFGGKIVIFGGDFRQTLPVVQGGSIFDQAGSCMINSALWTNIQVFHLTENLRLINTGDADSARDVRAFYAWLLTIGNGSEQSEFTADVPLQT